MERRNLTMMFTDIVGYSKLMGEDEDRTITMLDHYRRILVSQIDQFEGTVIEFIGDAIFARFDTPLAAVQAAIHIQNDLRSFNDSHVTDLPPLRTRIGIHTGEVAFKDGALFGDDVNIAARLEPIAVADGICVSECVYQAIQGKIRPPILALGCQPLKNISSSIKAFLIRPEGITSKIRLHYFGRKANQKFQQCRYPILAMVFLLIFGGVYFVPKWLVPGYNANYIEITDFKNLGHEQHEPDYLSRGISEIIKAQLADVKDIYIVRDEEGIEAPIRVEGNVQRSGDNVRVSYKLVRKKSNIQIAGGKLDSSYRDILILQDRLVAVIAKEIAREFSLDNFRPNPIDLTTDLTAYEFYLKGVDAQERDRTHENYDEAIQLFSNSLIHDSKFTQAKVRICRSYLDKYQLTKNINWIASARSYCEEAIDKSDNKSEVFVTLGLLYQVEGDIENAIKMFQSAIEWDEFNKDAYLNLVKSYSTEGRSEEAASVITEAIANFPKYWKVYDILGSQLLKEGNFEGAIEQYKQALELTPENVNLHNNLGVAYIYVEKYKSALRHFERVLESQENSYAFSNVGLTAYLSRDYQKSVYMFERAVKLSPKDLGFRANLADSLRQVGKFDKSKVQHLEIKNMALDRLNLNNSDQESHGYLAFAYIHLGEKDNAYIHIERALEINSQDLLANYLYLKILCFDKNKVSAIEVKERLVDLGYPLAQLEADPDFNLVN